MLQGWMSTVLRVDVRPELLRWARKRAGLPADANPLMWRFPKYSQWESGEVQPTFKQLERFAKVTNTPFGFLLLAEPPKEPFPIPDFRSAEGQQPKNPGLNLRDVVYRCDRRQEWFREHARTEHLDRVSIAGSASIGDNVEAIAARVRSGLKVDLQERAGIPTWTDALPLFIKGAETAGVLVMISGVVDNNTHRSLDPNEFRGFALADDFAPVVFVNGADVPEVQIFTLAHELAHVCLGESALSDMKPNSVPSNAVEAWCDGFAAELLVPIEAIREEWQGQMPSPRELKRLSRTFKVSTLVILSRLCDLGVVTRAQFHAAYVEELGRTKRRGQGRGGDFYTTLLYRVGEQFARALVTSTLEGKTLYRDALRLLGIKRISTFQNLADRLGLD